MPTEIKVITKKYLITVNCYLNNEIGHYLIDTGIAKKRDQLERELQEAGCQLVDLKMINRNGLHIMLILKPILLNMALTENTNNSTSPKKIASH